MTEDERIEDERARKNKRMGGGEDGRRTDLQGY
jgi:hypothetical protein